MEFSSEFGGAVETAEVVNGNTGLEGWGCAMVEAREYLDGKTAHCTKSGGFSKYFSCFPTETGRL